MPYFFPAVGLLEMNHIEEEVAVAGVITCLDRIYYSLVFKLFVI